MAFTGKSKLKLTIKTKPTPTGFKVKPPIALKGALKKPALNPT
ncbi:hypothetical protein S7711_07087 [Stachybotrys chartarum IBT 7711]|uniref:Uncharacterized protein n=1 Tax=Stachybotrys chartarum (strain CBS 109288 / IBT 7711) TaxID=1280523 RepID=A0A084B309_STACB|nr:hypothetical protein S7711_07087 [Stachybotrys chartarum IBT 7711]